MNAATIMYYLQHRHGILAAVKVSFTTGAVLITAISGNQYTDLIDCIEAETACAAWVEDT